MDNSTALRQYRIFGIAIADVVATAILAKGISVLTKYHFAFVFLFLLVFGEVLHWVMGIKTAGLTALGIDQNSDLGKPATVL
jgi:hypothetical protein